MRKLSRRKSGKLHREVERNFREGSCDQSSFVMAVLPKSILYSNTKLQILVRFTRKTLSQDPDHSNSRTFTRLVKTHPLSGQNSRFYVILAIMRISLSIPLVYFFV